MLSVLRVVLEAAAAPPVVKAGLIAIANVSVNFP